MDQTTAETQSDTLAVADVSDQSEPQEQSLDFKTFLDQDSNNFDDIIIDFNKIFLNSGIFFNIKSEAKLNIRLIHDTSDNFTIFQNNFINFKKRCEVKLEDNFNLTNNSINNINYNINVEEDAIIKHNIFQNFSNPYYFCKS